MLVRHPPSVVVTQSTHIDHVDVVVIGEGLQHLADGGPDELEGEARDAAAPTVWNKDAVCVKKQAS